MAENNFNLMMEKQRERIIRGEMTTSVKRERGGRERKIEKNWIKCSRFLSPAKHLNTPIVPMCVIIVIASTSALNFLALLRNSLPFYAFCEV